MFFVQALCGLLIDWVNKFARVPHVTVTREWFTVFLGWWERRILLSQCLEGFLFIVHFFAYTWEPFGSYILIVVQTLLSILGTPDLSMLQHA